MKSKSVNEAQSSNQSQPLKNTAGKSTNMIDQMLSVKLPPTTGKSGTKRTLDKSPKLAQSPQDQGCCVSPNTAWSAGSKSSVSRKCCVSSQRQAASDSPDDKKHTSGKRQAASDSPDDKKHTSGKRQAHKCHKGNNKQRVIKQSSPRSFIDMSAVATTGKREASLSATTGKREASLSATTGKREASLSATTGKREASLSATTGKREASLSATTGKGEASLSATTGKGEASLSATTGKREASLSATTGKGEAGLSTTTGKREASLNASMKVNIMFERHSSSKSTKTPSKKTETGRQGSSQDENMKAVQKIGQIEEGVSVIKTSGKRSSGPVKMCSLSDSKCDPSPQPSTSLPASRAAECKSQTADGSSRKRKSPGYKIFKESSLAKTRKLEPILLLEPKIEKRVRKSSGHQLSNIIEKCPRQASLMARAMIAMEHEEDTSHNLSARTRVYNWMERRSLSEAESRRIQWYHGLGHLDSMPTTTDDPSTCHVDVIWESEQSTASVGSESLHDTLLKTLHHTGDPRLLKEYFRAQKEDYQGNIDVDKCTTPQQCTTPIKCSTLEMYKTPEKCCMPEQQLLSLDSKTAGEKADKETGKAMAHSLARLQPCRVVTPGSQMTIGPRSATTNSSFVHHPIAQLVYPPNQTAPQPIKVSTLSPNAAYIYQYATDQGATPSLSPSHRDYASTFPLAHVDSRRGVSSFQSSPYNTPMQPIGFNYSAYYPATMLPQQTIPMHQQYPMTPVNGQLEMAPDLAQLETYQHDYSAFPSPASLSRDTACMPPPGHRSTPAATAKRQGPLCQHPVPPVGAIEPVLSVNVQPVARPPALEYSPNLIHCQMKSLEQLPACTHHQLAKEQADMSPFKYAVIHHGLGKAFPPCQSDETTSCGCDCVNTTSSVCSSECPQRSSRTIEGSDVSDLLRSAHSTMYQIDGVGGMDNIRDLGCPHVCGSSLGSSTPSDRPHVCVSSLGSSTPSDRPHVCGSSLGSSTPSDRPHVCGSSLGSSTPSDRPHVCGSSLGSSTPSLLGHSSLNMSYSLSSSLDKASYKVKPEHKMWAAPHLSFSSLDHKAVNHPQSAFVCFASSATGSGSKETNKGDKKAAGSAEGSSKQTVKHGSTTDKARTVIVIQDTDESSDDEPLARLIKVKSSDSQEHRSKGACDTVSHKKLSGLSKTKRSTSYIPKEQQKSRAKQKKMKVLEQTKSAAVSKANKLSRSSKLQSSATTPKPLKDFQSSKLLSLDSTASGSLGRSPKPVVDTEDKPRGNKVARNRPVPRKAVLGINSTSKKHTTKMKAQPVWPITSPNICSNHGWSWVEEGRMQPVPKLTQAREEPVRVRKCYQAMRHSSGETVSVRDCVILQSEAESSIPFVAKVSALWENLNGEMMFSMLWYYQPEHTATGRESDDGHQELFASKHREENSVACIDDRCFVLMYNEYCRLEAEGARHEQGVPLPRWRQLMPAVSEDDQRFCRALPPASTCADNIWFCRYDYDIRKKVVKKPKHKKSNLRYRAPVVERSQTRSLT